MKTYMVHSNDGAVLVVAKTARAAKSLAWSSGECFIFMDDRTNLVVRWLRGRHVMTLADQEKLAGGIEHVVSDPLACESCGEWGHDIDDEGTCLHCGGYAGKLMEEILLRARRC